MKLVRQKLRLDLSSFNDSSKRNSSVKEHGQLLPNNIRAVMAGSSGSGKTCLMMGLLEHEEGLRFLNVYVFCKTLFQNKYQRLKTILSGIPGIGYHEYNDDIPPLSDIKPYSVVIFDDVASCKNIENLEQAYSLGRHKHLSIFFLTQTYTKVKKHLIRDNFNMIILYKQDQLNLKHVYDEHVIGDASFKLFVEMCSKCWNAKYGFLVIDKQSEKNKGRYRKGFDEFFILDD